MDSSFEDTEYFVIENGILFSGEKYQAECTPEGKRIFLTVPYHHPLKSKRICYSFEIANQRAITFPHEKPLPELTIYPGITRQEYIRKVEFLKDQIQKGNIYEINFCIQFYARDVSLDPLTVFHRLNNLTRAPYCRMVKLKDDYILSASPELFLKKQGSQLFTKPIKGTIKRGASKTEDDQLKSFLFNNKKERTENVMAVDVARNDLSRIAQRGSVNVNKLYNIESFETVHQMVSTVSCELKVGNSITDILDATFPMASMTGAPKISAMTLIDETEDFKRNYYSGALGFMEANGDFELAVAIRSIFYNSTNKYLSFAVGSAITHLCDPEKEYDECLLKAGALLSALNARIKN